MFGEVQCVSVILLARVDLDVIFPITGVVDEFENETHSFFFDPWREHGCDRYIVPKVFLVVTAE